MIKTVKYGKRMKTLIYLLEIPNKIHTGYIKYARK